MRIVRSKIGNYVLCVGIIGALIGGLVMIVLKWKAPKPFARNVQ